MQGKSSDFARLHAQGTIIVVVVVILILILVLSRHQILDEKCNFADTTVNMVVDKDEQVLQFIGREDVNQYVVISYTMLVSEKAELEIEVIMIKL